jgi:glutamate--cysteine ligase
MNLEDAKRVVPNLTTSLTGPLLALERDFLIRQIDIETWLRKAWLATPAPIHGSVDLRNAGFKLAPVDTNLFPGGFNNLSADSLPLCIQALQATFAQHFPACEKILLIPENHTRNLFYLENIARLTEMLSKAGFQVRIGSLLSELTEPQTIDLPSGHQVCLEPVQRCQNKLYLKNFTPCLIMLNTDLSDGLPDILTHIEQTIQPPVELGWNHRLKSTHFGFYHHIAEQFSQDMGINPWLINPMFDSMDDMDFTLKNDLEMLAEKVDRLLQTIKQAYHDYRIDSKPFVVVKPDSGTYGRGVLPVMDAQQILTLNRKERTKMAARKGKRNGNRLILQEGIPTCETIGHSNDVAEPVVYLLGQHVVGGFYRIHKDKREHENLNSPGMHFQPLAFKQSCNNPDMNQNPDACPNRFYAYGVVARLALLAAAHELKHVYQDKPYEC